MNPEEIGQILDEIGERVGPAGEYAWQIAVAHESISSWIALAIPLFAVLVGLAIIAATRGRNIDWDAPNLANLSLILAGVMAFGGTLAFMMVVGRELPDALIPEWGVLRNLIDAVP